MINDLWWICVWSFCLLMCFRGFMQAWWRRSDLSVIWIGHILVESQCEYMELYGIIWNYMELYGIQSNGRLNFSLIWIFMFFGRFGSFSRNFTCSQSSITFSHIINTLNCAWLSTLNLLAGLWHWELCTLSFSLVASLLLKWTGRYYGG